MRIIIIIAIIVVASAVTIQLLKDSSGIAKWLFTFVNDWAPALSATAVVVLIITFFWNLRENRREKTRRAIYDWAKDAMKVTISSLDKKDFLIILRNAGTLTYDADSLGKTFKSELMVAIDAITSYCDLLDNAKKDKLREQAQTIFDSLGHLTEHLLND